MPSRGPNDPCCSFEGAPLELECLRRKRSQLPGIGFIQSAVDRGFCCTRKLYSVHLDGTAWPITTVETIIALQRRSSRSSPPKSVYYLKAALHLGILLRTLLVSEA